MKIEDDMLGNLLCPLSSDLTTRRAGIPSLCAQTLWVFSPSCLPESLHLSSLQGAPVDNSFPPRSVLGNG